jgi:hypothetical protein
MQASPSRSFFQTLFWPIAGLLVIVGLVCWGLRAFVAQSETGGSAQFGASVVALALGIPIWAGAAALCAMALKLLSKAHDFWVALAAMWRPLALVVIGAFLLFFTDQGRELGVSLMINSQNWNALVFLFVALFLTLLYWSLNSWLSARLGVRTALHDGVLGVIPTHPLPEKPNARIVTGDERWLFWLPRLLGVCARFFAAVNLAFAAWNQQDFIRETLLIRLLAWTAPVAIIVFTGLVYIFDRYALSERTRGEKWAAARFGSLAAAVLLLLAIATLAFVNFHHDQGVWARFWWGTFTISLSAFGFLILVSFLRRHKPIGPDVSVEDRRDDDRIEAESVERWIWGLFVPTLIAFVLVWFWAPMVGRTLGSIVVAYFALGAVLATVNAFELAIAKVVQRGWFGEGARPRVVGAYVAVALVALGFLNAWLHPFHRVRLCQGDDDCIAPASAAAYVHDPESRPSVEDAAHVWYKQAKAAYLEAHGGQMDKDERVPMVVVATAGGGIRAAYWTATVLEKLKKDLSPNGLRPYLFAISGVSGGSVGATAFEAALAKNDESGCVESCTEATDFLKEDFLAPTLAAGIFKDVPASFLPDPGQYDRGAALEQGFEHASEGLLTRPFLSLFPYGDDSAPASWRPILLLNATQEESGKRIITSHVLIERNVFVDALDALHVLQSDVRASTAAHNSARFSYISPAGNLGRRDDPTANSLTRWLEDWNGSIIDGGYFENYGAVSALELARYAKANLEKKEHAQVKLVVLMISSDPDLAKAHPLVRIEEPNGAKCVVSSTERESGTPPGSPNYLSVDPGQVANTWLNEFVAPLQGVEAAREAHGNLAAADLALEICGEFQAPGQAAPSTNASSSSTPAASSQMTAANIASQGKTAQVTDKAATAEPNEPYFAHLAMCRDPDVTVNPPLGWVLSQATQQGLDDLVKHCGNADQLTELEKALGGPQRQASAAPQAN